MKTFADILNQYISEIGCTYAELAEKADLSPASVSRYCSGNRIPKASSTSVSKLSHGLAVLAAAKSIDLPEEEIQTYMSESLTQNRYEDFASHFDTLINTLGISIVELAKNVQYDPSYVSRIRSGQRSPLNIDEFVENTCRFVVRKYSDETSISVVSELIACEKNYLESSGNYFDLLMEWFGSPLKAPVNKVDGFLKKLDDFDLNEYIKSIHFDELKVPTMPFRLPTSKNYYGLEQMKQGELDFFKTSVLAKSTEPIFMCGDMQMDDMAQDSDFAKKWMFAIAMSIKKGLHINIIHDIDRPFNEMMIGLESWIPIYMTGQVSPYHFKDISNTVYHHLTYVSGVAALSGECIDGHHNKGKYYLTNNKEELAYYRQKAKFMLSKATPLMEIFQETEKNDFDAFMANIESAKGNRRNILSSLPLYTISDELLDSMLAKNGVSAGISAQIKEYVKKQKQSAEEILSENKIEDELPEISEAEFAESPMALALAGAFLENEILYSYEDYTLHMKLTREYEKTQENYEVKLSKTQAFRNIQIHIMENQWVLISKSKAPNIHFLIRHPKMVDALQNFIVPVYE